MNATNTKARNRTAVEEVMGELCVYGGLLATRGEVYADLVTVHRSHGQKLNHVFIDRLTWMPPKATPEQAKFLADRGMTLKAMKAAEFVLA